MIIIIIDYAELIQLSYSPIRKLSRMTGGTGADPGFSEGGV